jgi:methylenetetrahydrofolate dehydrogenase (NADP+)/methenyltetrahydrofolate cyclohydrolase
MRLFNGRKVADKILKDLKTEIKKKKIKPVLAVILVGDDAPSKIYVRLKKEAGKKVGIKVDVYKFKAQEKERTLIKKIKELNKDKKIQGIIVQLPLPPHFNKNKITGMISPLKDVDGFHKSNQKLLVKGKPRFVPPLPAAILLAIRAAYNFVIPAHAGIHILDSCFRRNDTMGERVLRGRKAMALVNSDTFGRVLKMVLEKEGLKFNYLVRKVCMISGSEEEFQDADILITACGCPNLVGKGMIKKGAVIVDAGITRFHDKKVVGDVNRKEVSKKAGFLTPVPGGVGPVAVVLLLRNVLVATLRNYG